MTRQHLHIIANPQAGSGNALKTIQTIETLLTNKKIPYTTYLTQYASHEKEITQELLNTTLIPWNQDIEIFPLLLVVGGDGTLHEVTNSLADYPDIPIAYIAAGSGNDFARGLSLTKKIDIALETIISLDEPCMIPLIATSFNEQGTPRLVLNNIGIGIDAHVVATANQSVSKSWLNKMKLGSLSYLKAAFKVLAHQGGFPISFETPQIKEQFDNAYLCTITNHPYFGGGIAIDPTAELKKEEMSLVIVEKINLFLIIYLIIRLLLKKHLSSKYVHQFTSQEFILRSTQSEYCQTDGEVVGNQPQEIHCKMTHRLFWV